VKVILFGATGMVGQSALRECLLDDRVKEVLAVGRSLTGKQHEKLREVELNSLTELSIIEHGITGFDACFFCVGVSAAGMKEEEYTKITYDLTLSVAETLVGKNPNMTFIYITGRGTDSSEKGNSKWARVKGKTENALLRLPFKAAYMLRPSFILPLHGVKSKTRWYQTLYDILKPFNPLLLKLKGVITSEELGKAMIHIAKNGYPRSIIESYEIKKIFIREEPGS
jgi:uncharacterized protein YbjT (DUF2867 family)